MGILLVTPPLTQLSTPYPATTVLKAYLKEQGHKVTQCDLGIELIDKLYTKGFLEKVFEIAFNKDRLSPHAKSVAMLKQEYLDNVETVVSFLRGENNTLSVRIANGNLLPRGHRVRKASAEDMEWAFGTSGLIEKAKYLSTLFIEEIADFTAEVVSDAFSLVRYNEQIALNAPTFNTIYEALKVEPNIIEKQMIDLLKQKVDAEKYSIIGFTIPFPGCLPAALRLGQWIKQNHKNITVAIGGGYINTELRNITDVRIFESVDFILYDDGQLPMESLKKFTASEIKKDEIIRAKYLDKESIVSTKGYDKHLSEESLPTPDFSDLKLSKYLSTIEFTNPMHKLWSDGRWNKLTIAHGCYWAKCAFCDTTLDYIGRYDAPKAETVVSRMESIMAQTGESGFHFTDEALPPKLLREIAEEILKRNLTVSFWGNIRFEKNYDSDLCKLLAKAGCIAVSGGLEVASPRVLRLIDKGITIEGAVKTMAAFNEAGIMVHTYLMYGFPSQTLAESVDSLEIVRQMFLEGIVQSAFWHRYAMTIHSESGCNAAKYGVKRASLEMNPFANNAVEYIEDSKVDWTAVGDALSKATYNYMQGVGYDTPLKKWFEGTEVRISVAKNHVSKILCDS